MTDFVLVLNGRGGVIFLLNIIINYISLQSRKMGYGYKMQFVSESPDYQRVYMCAYQCVPRSCGCLWLPLGTLAVAGSVTCPLRDALGTLPINWNQSSQALSARLGQHRIWRLNGLQGCLVF